MTITLKGLMLIKKKVINDSNWGCHGSASIDFVVIKSESDFLVGVILYCAFVSIGEYLCSKILQFPQP